MKILFVIAHMFYSEPLGVMLLSALCKKRGHDTRLAVLSRRGIDQDLKGYDPDVVAYSVMSADEHLFVEADEQVKEFMTAQGRQLLRIMGGPHPTYFPEIVNRLGMDAIVVGDGDNALPAILERIETGRDLDGIPNVMTPGQPEFTKEVVSDMDRLPFMDRELFYDYDPSMRKVGLRSFLTQRGCPFKCTYCYNPSFNQLFIKGSGVPLMRRRSVDNVLEEIEQVIEHQPPVRVLRFADDVFAQREDDPWLVEFADKYPKRIGLPFYCLVKPNSMTEKVAKLLSDAGCISVSMSIDAGTPYMRNTLLKRNLTDEKLIEAFDLTRKYGMTTESSTILGLPGTTLEDDYTSFLFARRVKPSAPTFTIFCPYPKTHLAEYALSKGLLDSEFDYKRTFRNRSVLNNYTEKEKDIQLRLSYLAPIFCFMPDCMLPVLRFLIRRNLTGVYGMISSIAESYLRSWRIFPGAQPRNPVHFFQAVVRTIRYVFKTVEKKGAKSRPSVRPRSLVECQVK